MPENQRHTETCIAINDKSQGSVAPRLRCDDWWSLLSFFWKNG